MLLELRVPLGLLIEEQQLTSGGSTPAEAAALGVGAAGGGAGTIQVTGALPGYSAFNKVEKGDLLRAVTVYAAVAGSGPMWQQVASALRAHLHPNPLTLTLTLNLTSTLTRSPLGRRSAT